MLWIKAFIIWSLFLYFIRIIFKLIGDGGAKAALFQIILGASFIRATYPFTVNFILRLFSCLDIVLLNLPLPSFSWTFWVLAFFDSREHLSPDSFKHVEVHRLIRLPLPLLQALRIFKVVWLELLGCSNILQPWWLILPLLVCHYNVFTCWADHRLIKGLLKWYHTFT